jgi:spore maturation protein CgeB
MGCGALMLSDAGNYPQGMTDGVNMLTYNNLAEAVSTIADALHRPDDIDRLARCGFEMISTRYSKANQWHDFQVLVGNA